MEVKGGETPVERTVSVRDPDSLDLAPVLCEIVLAKETVSVNLTAHLTVCDSRRGFRFETRSFLRATASAMLLKAKAAPKVKAPRTQGDGGAPLMLRGFPISA